MYEVIEVIVATFDREQGCSPGAVTSRDALAIPEKRQNDARKRLATTLKAHPSFLNAPVAASRRLRVADGRLKSVTSADAEEELDNPKLFKRKLAELWGGGGGVKKFLG